MNQYGRYTKRYQLQLIKEDIERLQDEYDLLFYQWLNAKWYIAWHYERKLNKLNDEIALLKGERIRIKKYWEGH